MSSVLRGWHIVAAPAGRETYDPPVETRLQLEMARQPDDSTCGPTCLQAIYRFYDDDAPLDRLIREVPALDGGGTMGVLLACHALERGYTAVIYTYNLVLFDPTWFQGDVDIAAKLRAQRRVKRDHKLRYATDAYLRYLELGGELRLRELDDGLLRRCLVAGTPILTGLSATYLYWSARETPDGHDDDVGGTSAGHFVVLAGYNRDNRSVLVLDPYRANPSDSHEYELPIDRVVGAVLLGVLSYDANLVILEPRQMRAANPR